MKITAKNAIEREVHDAKTLAPDRRESKIYGDVGMHLAFGISTSLP